MTKSVLEKIGLYLNSVFNVKLHQGSYLKYVFIRLANLLRSRLSFMNTANRKENWMIVENTLGTFKVNTADDTINKSTPTFEYYLHSWIPEGEDGIFIDLGANVGFYSLFAVNKRAFKKVISFEPNPYTFDILQQNIRLNNLENTITVENKAVGKEKAKIFLKQEKEHTGGSKVVSERDRRTKDIDHRQQSMP